MVIRDKKGVELALETIVIFIILLIVFIVIVFFFVRHYGGGSEAIFEVGKSASNVSGFS